MRSRVAHGCLLTCILTAAATAWGEDWPWLRGPRHDGLSAETGWKKEFQGKPEVLWQMSLGDAYSSFACVGDRVYTCGTKDNQQTVYCLDAKKGAVIWQKGFAKEYRDGQGNGPRSTPTVDDGRVYVVGAEGTLACLNAASGQALWTKKLGQAPGWGHSGSVLIEGDLAIVAAGSPEGSLIAYNKKSGQKIWGAGKDRAGYATPYPFTFAGRLYVVGFLCRSFIIVDVKSGKEVFSEPWQTEYDVNAASPIFKDGYLFLSSGYGTGGALYKLAKKGANLAAEVVWKNKDVQTRFSSMVLHKGALYGMAEGAFICADFLTGNVRWREPHPNWGNGIVADGHLIVLSAQGRLEIAKASETAYKPETKVQVLSGKCWTVPVVHDGRLYVRNTNTVMCLDLKGR